MEFKIFLAMSFCSSAKSAIIPSPEVAELLLQSHNAPKPKMQHVVRLKSYSCHSSQASEDSER